MTRKPFLLLLVLLLLCGTALAADVEIVDMDSASGTVSTTCGYVRLTCTLAGEQSVSVTVWDAEGRVTYQRDHGTRSGAFRSEDIPLKKRGSEGSYRVALTVDGSDRTLTVRRLLSRVTHADASTTGHRIGKSVTVTMVDLSAGSCQAALVSGGLKVGTVTFQTRGGSLTARVSMEDGATLESATVYAAADRSEASRLGGKHSSCASGAVGETLTLDGAEVCAVWLRATVSFDPNGLEAAPSEDSDTQDALWQRLP